MLLITVLNGEDHVLQDIPLRVQNIKIQFPTSFVQLNQRAEDEQLEGNIWCVP